MQEKRRNNIGLFAGILAAFGASLPIIDTATDRRDHTDGRKSRTGNRRLASEDDYQRTDRGYLMRTKPKRDKSISARQWKKRVKAQRRAEKYEG